MTIRNLLDAGVKFDGDIIIRIWNDDLCDYDVDMNIEVNDYYFNGLEAFLEGNEDLLDRKIVTVYPIMDYNREEDEVPFMVYELEGDNED